MLPFHGARSLAFFDLVCLTPLDKGDFLVVVRIFCDIKGMPCRDCIRSHKFCHPERWAMAWIQGTNFAETRVLWTLLPLTQVNVSQRPK